MTEDRVRGRLAELAAELPEAEVSGDQHLSFRVRGKPFAYHMIDHHGDGRVGLAVKVPNGTRDSLIADDPERYYVPERLGAAWVAVALDAEPVEWNLLRGLTIDSYRLVAPKSLAARLDS